MRTGRKPKPTHLKLVTGNPGKRALPKADSVHLSAAQRASGAAGAFALRPGALERVRRAAPGSVTVLLDDIVTTGATLAAAAALLAGAGVRVDACVTLAATRRIAPQREIWS